MTAIITINDIAPLVLLAMVAACGVASDSAVGNDVNQQTSAHGELADLPHLRGPAVRSPYIRYSETTHRADSPGLVFFLYPLVRRRNELLAVEHEPGTPVSGNFSQDIAGGMSGLVLNGEREIRVDFLPISLPFDAAPNEQWHLRHASRDFTCTSRVGAETSNAEMLVTCASQNYTLTFSFDRERGITQFQDFCGRSICTYRLEDPQGLLSREMVAYMGLRGV